MTTDQFTRPEQSTDQFDSSSTQEQQPHPLAEAGREAGESAGHIAERAANIGIQQADRGREQAASGLAHVAESIRRVSGDLESQPALADAAQTAAEQADRIAQYLRETDAREMISNVEDMARRQPLVFIGGAFVLGFVAARFIKAAGGIGGSEAQRSFGSGNGSGRMQTGVASLGTTARTTGRSGGDW